MIKLFIYLILAITLFVPQLSAETWVSANQKTVAWDPVTFEDDGTVVPADQIKYQVFTLPYGSEEATAYGSEISATSLTITFSDEGQYYVGVKAIRYLDGAAVSDTAISWSNDPEACKDGKTFGIRYVRALNKLTGIR